MLLSNRTEGLCGIRARGLCRNTALEKYLGIVLTEVLGAGRVDPDHLHMAARTLATARAPVFGLLVAREGALLVKVAREVALSGFGQMAVALIDGLHEGAIFGNKSMHRHPPHC